MVLLLENFYTTVPKKKLRKNSKKKHVETMFLTNKPKKYPYYFKPNLKTFCELSNTKLNIKKQKIFYIRALTSMYLTIEPLKALVRIFKWFTKVNKVEEFFKYKLFVFPNFVLTSKPKDIRMGKGKGAPSSKVCLIKKNQIIFSLIITDFSANYFLVFLLLKQLLYKLPKNFIITFNFW